MIVDSHYRYKIISSMEHKDIYIDESSDRNEKENIKVVSSNNCAKNTDRYSLPVIPFSKDYATPFGSIPLYEIIEVSEDEQSTDRSKTGGSPQRRYSTGTISKNFPTSSLAEFLRTTSPSDFFKEKTKTRKGVRHYLSKIFGSSQESKYRDINSKDIISKNKNTKSHSLFKKRSHSLDSIYTSKGRMNYTSQIYEINDQGKMVFKDPNFKPSGILRNSISCLSSSEIEEISETRAFSISFPERRVRKKSVKMIAPSHRDIIYISDDEEYQDARRGYSQQILDNTFQYFFDIPGEFDIESDRILTDLHPYNPDLENHHTIDTEQSQVDNLKDSKKTKKQHKKSPSYKHRKSENRKKQEEYMTTEELNNGVDNNLLNTRDSLLLNRSPKNSEESSDLNEDFDSWLSRNNFNAYDHDLKSEV